MTDDRLTGPIQLHPLTFLDEGDDVTIGRLATSSFGVFPPDGAALLRRLVDGECVEDAADWYERAYGERIDLLAFLSVVDELGFLRHDGDTTPSTVSRRALPLQRVGRWAFSVPAWVLFVVLVSAAVTLCWIDPGLRPHPHQVFFTSYLVVVELSLAAGQLPLILIHELCHVLAARRIGVRARIGVSQRFYFVVFETQMDGLVLVPRRQRYLPILAGMLADVVLAAALTVTAALLRRAEGPASVVAAVCLALAFTTLVRCASELVLFLRTDVYYLAATVSGCVDLHRTAHELIANVVAAALRRPRPYDPETWHPHDRRAARWYAPLYAAGYLVAAALLVGVLAPVLVTVVRSAGLALLGADPTSAHFWDALGLLALNLAQPAAAGLLALRERRQRHSRSTSPSAPSLTEVTP